MRNRWMLVFVIGSAAIGQTTARIDRNGTEATLIVESPRPVDDAAALLGARFGLRISTEDPPLLFGGDVRDVTTEVWRGPNPGRRVLVPRGFRLEVTFGVDPNGAPRHAEDLVARLVRAANGRSPFSYRVDDGSDDVFTVVPTRTRDAHGNSVAIVPLLDRLVTIVKGTRPLAESASMMAAELSSQTGLRVSCCQSVVGGIPWGMGVVEFEARGEPARSVLKRLVMASLQGRANPYRWSLRCDPLPSEWCFIDLNYIPQPQTASAVEAHPPASTPSRWFDAVPPKRQ